MTGVLVGVAVTEEVAVSKIEGHADNPRLVLRDVEQLAASIKANGLTSTLTVMRHPSSKVKFILLCGHRRLAALKQLRTKMVTVRVFPSTLTRLQQMQIIMDDNTEADALTVTEQARGVQTMIELEGFDFAAYAKAKRMTQKAIKEQASLAAAPPAVRVKLDAYQMTDSDYFAIREFAEDTEVFAGLVDVAGTSSFDYEIRMARRQRDLPGLLEAGQAAIDESGCKAIAFEHKYGSSSWEKYSPAQGVTPLTPAEHGVLKHRYDLDQNTGKLTWFAPIQKLAKTAEEENPEPVRSEEEIAAQARIDELQAGLDIAAELLDEHLKAVITAGDPVMAQKAAVALFKMRLHRYEDLEPRQVGVLAGLSAQCSVAELMVRLAEMTADQLAILHLAVNVMKNYTHNILARWDANGHFFEQAEASRTVLDEVLAYQQISIEAEALEHFAKLKAIDDAHWCKDCGEWSEAEVNADRRCVFCAKFFCVQCGVDIDSDEDLDGKCQICAAAVEGGA